MCSEGFAVCPHMMSLSQDLTSDQEKLPRNRKKPSRGKKERNLQESNRGGSLSMMDRGNICHVYRRNHYRVTTHSMSMTLCMNSW